MGLGGGGPPLARDGGVYFSFLSVRWGLRVPWAIWPEGLKFLFDFDS